MDERQFLYISWMYKEITAKGIKVMACDANDLGIFFKFIFLKVIK